MHTIAQVGPQSNHCFADCGGFFYGAQEGTGGPFLPRGPGENQEVRAKYAFYSKYIRRFGRVVPSPGFLTGQKRGDSLFRCLWALRLSHPLPVCRPVFAFSSTAQARHRQDFPRRTNRPQPRGGRRRHASVFLKRWIVSNRMADPRASNAAICGHRMSNPTPFRKMPREMITK